MLAPQTTARCPSLLIGAPLLPRKYGFCIASAWHRSRTMGEAIRLADGRAIGYAEFGNPEGQALFYFHGDPGSGLEARFLAQAAEVAGVRLLGMDRPGMGLSTYQPGRQLLDWPDDVAELADRLGIDR